MASVTIVEVAAAGQAIFDHPFIATPTDVKVAGVAAPYTETITNYRRSITLTTPATLGQSVEITGDLPAVPSVGGGGGGGSYDQPGLPTSLGQKVKTGSTSVVLASDQGTLPVSLATSVAVTGPLTDTQLRASAVPVSLSSSPGLTDTQLRAAAVPVSGPLTDTQLRAAAVPVSGPLTDTQLRAAAVLVNSANEVGTGGNLAAVSAQVLINQVGQGGGILQITGTFVGTAILEGSADGGTTYVQLSSALNVNTGALAAASFTTVGMWQFESAGMTQVRLRMTAYTSGTMVATLRATNTGSMHALDSPLPAGANIIGALTANQSVNVAQFGGTTPVTGGTAGLTGVGGPTAHSAASSGNPVRVAGRVNTAADITLVAGDVSDLFMTTGGQLVTKDFATSELDWQVIPAAITVTTDVVAKAAGGASIRNYMTALQVQNTGGTATLFSVKDGAATVIFQISLPASMAVPAVINFPTPLRGTAATAMNFACGTASSVLANAQGYQSF